MQFFIVDGSGFLFRAYYSFPRLINSDNININVVYGFCRMILKLIEYNPEYILITRDLPIKTKRHEINTDYKANRPDIPEDFSQQIPLVHEIIEKLGIPNLGVPGYEADDIINTAVKISPEDIKIKIYSSDKDLKQLLKNNVVMEDPVKSIVYTKDNFKIEYGFESQYIVDYLSLIGDSSDNIKGVPGIGPKKAIKLIQDYKTIENVYLNIDKLPQDIQDKLIKGKQSAIRSKMLIELMDVPDIGIDLFEKCKFKVDIGHFYDILVQEYKFDSLKKVLNTMKKNLYMPQQQSLF